MVRFSHKTNNTDQLLINVASLAAIKAPCKATKASVLIFASNRKHPKPQQHEHSHNHPRTCSDRRRFRRTWLELRVTPRRQPRSLPRRTRRPPRLPPPPILQVRVRSQGRPHRRPQEPVGAQRRRRRQGRVHFGRS
jgi:hypothetical protein